MNSYRTICYWWNDMQSAFMIQIGYEIIGKAKTERGVRSKIDKYLDEDENT